MIALMEPEKVRLGKWGGSTVVPLDNGILTKSLGLKIGSEVHVDYSQIPERIILTFPKYAKS